jgi:proteic killer suppression protein
VIISFRNRGTEDIFRDVDSQQARNVCPPQVWRVARRKLDRLDYARSLDDLKEPPGNRLHLLKKERAGQYAIRINDQYRVCFWWTEAGAEDVEVTDYH